MPGKFKLSPFEMVKSAQINAFKDLKILWRIFSKKNINIILAAVLLSMLRFSCHVFFSQHEGHFDWLQ